MTWPQCDCGLRHPVGVSCAQAEADYVRTQDEKRANIARLEAQRVASLPVNNRRPDTHAATRLTTVLYEQNTYARTALLNDLACGDRPLTPVIVLMLFEVFCEGCADADVPPTMVEFGDWLAGDRSTNAYSTVEPADVIW